MNVCDQVTASVVIPKTTDTASPKQTESQNVSDKSGFRMILRKHNKDSSEAETGPKISEQETAFQQKEDNTNALSMGIAASSAMWQGLIMSTVQTPIQAGWQSVPLMAAAKESASTLSAENTGLLQRQIQDVISQNYQGNLTVSSKSAGQNAMNETPANVKTEESVKMLAPEAVDTPVAKKAADYVLKPHLSDETQETPDVAIKGDTPIFQSVDTVPVKVGETQTIHTETADFDEKLVNTISTTQNQGLTKVKLSLTPASLGNIEIELSQNVQGSLQVVIHTTTEKATNLLLHHSQDLGQLLQASNNANVQISVDQQSEKQAYQENYSQHNGGHGGYQQQQHRHTTNEDFLNQLRLGLISTDEQAS